MAEAKTISFIVEDEQLARVDALAAETDRSRSAMLRVLIDVGEDALRARRAQHAVAVQREAKPLVRRWAG